MLSETKLIKKSLKAVFIISCFFCLNTFLLAQNKKPTFQSSIDSGNYYLNSNASKANFFYNQAFDIADRNNNKKQKAYIYSRLGTLNRIKADYPKSIEYHLKSLEINEALKDSSSIAANYHNIAMVMRFQEDYESAKLYFKKAIELRKALKEDFNLGVSYNMLGVIYRREGDYESAEDYYEKAFNTFKLLNNKDQLMITYGNLATLYDFKKEYKKSIDLNQATIPYYKSTNNNSVLTSIYSNLALSYQELKKYKVAITYLDSAIAIDKSQGYLERLSSNYLNRSNNYYQLKNYKLAIDDYRKHKQINDSVFNIQKIKETNSKLLQAEFENQKLLDSLRFAEREKRLELITQSEKTKKNTYFIMMLGAIVLGVFAFSSVKYKRDLTRTKLEKEQLESDFLKQKLNATEKEAQRIIQEKSISLTHKKNLLSQIKHLIKKHDSDTIFKDLNILSMDLDQQAKTEALHLVLDENVEKLHVEFEKKLIEAYPDLTKTEREICSLIRANMSIKDVANIKGVSSASVQSARYRIRKKMGLDKGEELHQFIQNLF